MASTSIERDQHRTCGTMQVLERLLEEDPTYRERLSDIEVETDQRTAGQRIELVPRTIRCVVHVLYKIDSENISDAQINSQMKVLNADFSATNNDVSNTPQVWLPLVADTQIRFELAKHAPDGSPTTGITRTRTAVSEFLASSDNAKFNRMGGKDCWPTARYLNMWVCALGQQLLGYGQFPGGPASTDGIVVLHSAFGTNGTAAQPYHLGRTATHEVGHWLNLRHIWGDTSNCSGSDNVSDTPTQRSPHFSGPGFPHISCNNGPNGDMYMNYMDYVHDDEMYMFTKGQAQRMNACLDVARTGVIV